MMLILDEWLLNLTKKMEKKKLEFTLESQILLHIDLHIISF
jgi:hypothetical protein